jgi:serine/threonine protein kinase
MYKSGSRKKSATA